MMDRLPSYIRSNLRGPYLNRAYRTSCREQFQLSAIVMVGIIVTGVPSLSSGQQQRRGRAGTPRRQTVSVLIEPSAPVANLFTRAEEGVARSDWKFAIDCLQRIIDNPEGSLVSRTDGGTDEGMLYESARRRAMRRLASLPPEGLYAYRLLYDGKAKRLYERGKASHDPDEVRVVVNRYLPTRYGDDAADWLASLALDAGRPSEALTLLTDLIELVPDPDVPKRLIAAKLAAAYALLGRPEEVEATVDAFQETGETETALEKLKLSLPHRLKVGRVDPDVLPDRWPIVGGSPARRGLMPAVEPTLDEAVPWRLDLPDADADAWRRVFNDGPDGPLVLPVGQLVSDGQRLFARTRQGCVAIDREDLALQWQSEETMANEETPARTIDIRHSTFDIRRAPVSDAWIAFDDYVAGSISSGHGLVMIISREGESEYTLAARDAGLKNRVAWLPIPNLARRQVSGTRLIAYEAETGRIRWQRGRTADPDDPLGNVDFRSVPIPVGDHVWVPYFRQGDLYAAVLDPEDGALVHNLLLCSVGSAGSIRSAAGGALPLWDALYPASADGLVYIPSGYGILFAVDASDYTLRWANQYRTVLDAPGSPGSDEGGTWLPTPPVVSGSLVLLAPTEHEELLAFSAATGEFRWRSRCTSGSNNGSYMIGADHDHVWIGGRSISCVSLLDGDLIWTVDVPSIPTGRACLSGTLVYIPMLDGLLSLDAVTGDALEYASLPETEDPLGNLLSLNNAMFIIGASNVRKFPDMGRSYPIALAQYEADPSDVVASIRLAWLELLRGEPQRAYDVLEKIPPVLPESGTGFADDGLGRAKDIAHVRVEALLALAKRAKEAGGTDADALALLEQANEKAQTASDRLRCGLAIGDRLQVMGRHSEAYRRLWQLGVSPAARQVVSLEEHVEGRARFDIARRLREIASQLTEPQQRQLCESIGEQASIMIARLGSPDGIRRGGPRAREERAQLRAIADLEPLGSISEHALMKLVSYHARRVHYEQAEQLLRETVRLTKHPALTATAMIRLCELYADATANGTELTTDLIRSLDDLESRFGSAEGGLPPGTMPTALRGHVFFGDDESAEGGPPVVDVSDWVRQIRSSIPDAKQTAYRLRTTNAPLQFTGELAWTLKAPIRSHPPRLVSFGSTVTRGTSGKEECPPTVLTERVVLYDPDDVVSCYDVRNGNLLWKTDLRLPEMFADPLGTTSTGVEKPGAHRAVVDGQTAVFGGTHGLFAVGLATGRRIWVRAHDLVGQVNALMGDDIPMAASDGLLAANPKGGRLTLMRMLDGSTIWERDLRGEPVEHIWMLRDRVVTADGLLQRVHIFDRANGFLVKHVLFKQPDPDRSRRAGINLVATGGVLCGPAVTTDLEGIVGVDIASGEIVWRTKLDKPLAQLFKPQEGYLGIGMLGGEVRIVEASTGDFLLEPHVPGAHAVVDGKLIDGTLLVQYYTTRDPNRYHVLAALDVATDTELWRRDDLASLTRFDDPLRIRGGRLPVVVELMEQGSKQKKKRLTFTMIDARTGLSTGAEVTLPPASGAVRLNGDFQVFPLAGVAVVGTDRAIHALRIDVAPEHTEGGL